MFSSHSAFFQTPPPTRFTPASGSDFMMNAKKALFDPNPPEEIMQAMEAMEAAFDREKREINIKWEEEVTNIKRAFEEEKKQIVAEYEKKIADLETKITQADEEARSWIAKKDAVPTAKARAMQVLKRKKMYEQQRDNLLGTQFNVENMAFQAESAQVTLTAVSAMTAATEQLKQQKDKISVAQVDKLTDDMADLQADMQDIQAALAGGASTEHDDEAAAELEALYAKEAEREEEEALKILMGGSASSVSQPVPGTSAPAAPARAAGQSKRTGNSSESPDAMP